MNNITTYNMDLFDLFLNIRAADDDTTITTTSTIDHEND